MSVKNTFLCFKKTVYKSVYKMNKNIYVYSLTYPRSAQGIKIYKVK